MNRISTIYKYKLLIISDIIFGGSTRERGWALNMVSVDLVISISSNVNKKLLFPFQYSIFYHSTSTLYIAISFTV